MEQDLRSPELQESGGSGLIPSGYLHPNHNCLLVSGSFQNYWSLCPTSKDYNFVGLGCDRVVGL